MADVALRGDLKERADGSFEGWCWSPDRPEERLIIDLVVDDRVATSIVAATFRRDLLTRGIGDGRHGFSLRLPANLPETVGEHFVTARERRSGEVFGRLLRGAPGGAIPYRERIDRVTSGIDELWQRLEAARATRAAPTAADRLRGGLGVLADRIAARRIRDVPDPGVRARGSPILLPDVANPALSIVLHAIDAAATLRHIAALAPAAQPAEAEFIVVDPGRDPYAALLPGRVRNLRYLRERAAATGAAALNAAVGLARGTHLLLLADLPATPSAAALLALAAALSAAPAVLLGSSAAGAMARQGQVARPRAALPGRLGLAVALDRALWPDLGPLDCTLHDGSGLEFADLGFRAHLFGLNVASVSEPACAQAAGRSALPAQAVRAALTAFRQRWGAAMLDPGRRPA